MLSAVVLLVVALLGLWFGGYPFALVVAGSGIVLCFEWATMCGYTVADPPTFWLPGVIVAASGSAGAGLAWLGLLLVLLAFIVALIWSRLPLHQPGGAAAGLPAGNRCVGPKTHRTELACGLPYFGLAAIALLWLRADAAVGLRNTLFVMAVVWSSDIGAYMVGRLIGGPKLAPRISPGKTWSGAAGGLLCAVLGSMAVAAGATPDIPASHVLGPAVLLGVISQAGDLLESAIKRHFGVKDSGRIIPGHGGLLDRVDALLAVAPVAALLAITVGRGVVLWR